MSRIIVSDFSDFSEQVFFDSVMGHIGGDDGNDSDVDLPAPGLTCHELLQAALMLKKHVALLNDPFSCKLEVMLGPVGIVWTADPCGQDAI